MLLAKILKGDRGGQVFLLLLLATLIGSAVSVAGLALSYPPDLPTPRMSIAQQIRNNFPGA